MASRQGGAKRVENGSKVTQRQLYQEVMALESRLGAKIDTVLAAVNDNRAANAGEFACLQAGFTGLKDTLEGKDGLKDRLGRLESSETRWRALTAFVSASAGAFFGWLSGKG